MQAGPRPFFAIRTNHTFSAIVFGLEQRQQKKIKIKRRRKKEKKEKKRKKEMQLKKGKNQNKKAKKERWAMRRNRKMGLTVEWDCSDKTNGSRRRGRE